MGTVALSYPSDGTTADAADFTTPIQTLASEFNGNIDNDNIKSAAAISGSKLADNSIDLGAKASTWDGWVEVSDSWTYASATTVTVPSDATTKYAIGDKVKFTNTTDKVFIITAVASTTLTLRGLTGATVANAAISAISYSKASTPQGVAYPPGSVAFHAYRNAAQSVGNSLETVVFDTERYDVGNNFNTSTGQFTAPVAGAYRFTAGVNNGTAAQTRGAIQFVGSTFGTRIPFDVTGTDLNKSGASLEIDCVASETVEVKVLQGSDQDVAGNETFFAGSLVTRF